MTVNYTPLWRTSQSWRSEHATQSWSSPNNSPLRVSSPFGLWQTKAFPSTKPRPIHGDYPNPFGGGSLGDEWRLEVNPELILEFEGVSSSEDYVIRQAKIVRKWIERTAGQRLSRGDADGVTDDHSTDSSISTVFIVHGHNEKTLGDVARTIYQLVGREAVILKWTPSLGQPDRLLKS